MTVKRALRMTIRIEHAFDRVPVLPRIRAEPTRLPIATIER